MPGHGTRQMGSLSSATDKALGKEGFNFFLFLKISSLPSASTGALGKEIIKKIKSLPSAVTVALGKVFFLKKILCRVPDLRHSAKDFKKNKSLPSARSGALGKEFFLKKIKSLSSA